MAVKTLKNHGGTGNNLAQFQGEGLIYTRFIARGSIPSFKSLIAQCSSPDCSISNDLPKAKSPITVRDYWQILDKIIRGHSPSKLYRLNHLVTFTPFPENAPISVTSLSPYGLILSS